MSNNLTDEEFRVLLDLIMVSDPWPIEQRNKRTLINLLNGESRKRGYVGHIQAYHEHE